MTKERLIELAKQAGWEYADDDRGFEPLWKFAALVIANHPPQSYMTWQEGYESGKQAERERLRAFMRQMVDAYSLQSEPSGFKARGNT
jgi:hypothetical protein